MKEQQPCRFIVLDTPRARVAKIASILKQHNDKNHHHADIILDETDTEAQQQCRFAVEFLPCVATFDSYQDEQHGGENIRYLASVDFYGPDVLLKKPQSLLPFFDQVEDVNGDDDAKDDEKNKNLGGICGVVVGMGIEGDEQDLARIKAFLITLSPTKNIPVESVSPIPPYATIKEELAAFRALDIDDKEEVTRRQSMGPGRMAKFVITFANKIIKQSLREEKGQDEHTETDGKMNLEEENGKEEKAADPSSSLEGDSGVVAAPRVIDPNKIRYSCRTCRTILFGHDDLEDPPHATSRHHFSRRKATHGLGLSSSSSSSSCESYFLQTSLVWMGEINGQNEGKFACCHCRSKLGTYNWSGAQCSCGTWVVPAIQIPKSRVDAILPANQQQSTGTAPIITPLILQPAATTFPGSATDAAPGQVVCD